MKRHKHTLSHYRLLTGDMGYLLPAGLVEVLPGDSFQHSANVLLRLSPMAAPVMHGMAVRVHHFFVPHRLVWEGWEDFITGGPDGKNADTIPTLSTQGTAKNLGDYYGLPLTPLVDVSALPFYGYNLIFNEWYRDQDLQTQRQPTDLTLARVGWEKDYFTASRPWPQKGDEITMPLGVQAPVIGVGYPEFTNGSQTFKLHEPTGGIAITGGPGNSSSDFDLSWVNSGLAADLTNATAVNINEVRRAFALQRFQEARARYGSRYTEYLRFLGVRPADARLQRPEYLGGGTANISVSEVLQTAPETGSADPEGDTAFGVGDMYGHGIAAMRSNRYRRFFAEHGYVHTFLSVRPKAIYSNGINRTWLKKDKEDFFQKELQFIGQQPVYLNEVYAEPTSGGDVFGYQDRYAEYREQPSLVCGEFRTVLDYWHLARQFTEPPALNSTFIECTPSKRIFNEQTMDSLWIMVQHKLVARRMVSRNAAGRII